MLKHSERIGRGRVRGASGATLIEVLVSLAILGLLLAAMLPFAVFAQENEVRRNEIRIGESLARSQLEYIKIQAYNPAPWQGGFPYEKLKLAGYGVYLNAEPIYPPGSPNSGSPCYPEDYGIQKITIKVLGWRFSPGAPSDWRPIFETTGYKVAPGQSLEITKYEVERGVGQ